MIPSRLGKTGTLFLLFAFFSGANLLLAQPCPTLGQNATLTSSDCAPGLTPCTLCPGDQFTLTPTGTNLVPGPGNCINWYYGTTNNFNPYIGEGTLLGCSPITATPPNSCNPCPSFLGIFVDACGTEENNEFLGLYSGGGFFVDELSVDFDAQNNTGGGANDDIGSGCGFQAPDGALLATLQADCPNSSIVGVGPGESVPPNVPVIVFTSSAADFNYNVSALCAVSGTIYVLQSSCARTFGAFSNGTSTGTRTTTVSLSCGCSSTITYDCGSLALANGAFVANTPLGVIYGTAGCSFPTFPGLPGGSNPVMVAPLNVTVTQAMCNGGPYFVVGILEPLPAGCTPVFTNYLGFNVPCPNPTLSAADVCDDVSNFDLNSLEDPAVPNGTWSGAGVSGDNFSAVGLNGAITLTFTPSGPCATAATTTITVIPTPGAVIAPQPPACPGSTLSLSISFSGQGPFDFELFANGATLGNFLTNDNPFLVNVPFNGATTYSVQNLTNGICNGPNASLFVPATGAPNAVLSLSGPSNICSGQSAQCNVAITGGSAPFTLTYAIDGVVQSPVTTNDNPAILDIPMSASGAITLTGVQAGSCTGTASGTANVTVTPAPEAEIQTGVTNICSGQTEIIQINFSGTGPFTFEYAINGVGQGPITTGNTLFEIMAMPISGTNIYTLLSVSAGGCTGTVIGADTLIVAPPPTAVLSGDQTICAGDTTDLMVVYTGPGPFLTFYSINGALQPPFTAVNDTFLLSVHPGANTTYTLDSVATNGCPGMAGGQSQITVGVGPTAILSGGGPTCTGGSGVGLTINFTGTPPFSFEYTANGALQAPIVTNLTTYNFNVNPPGGVVYLPVSVSDANCTGLVSGQAVVFVFTQPTANMFGDQTFCDSANTNITIDFTGTGPFTVEYTRDGVPQTPLNTTDDPFLIPVNTDSTTNFVLTQVTSPGCLGLISGTATITIQYEPTITNLQQICNPVGSVYRVQFDIVGGTPPYTLVGGSGVFAGNTFTSDDIPQALPYNIVFRDAANCGDVNVSGISTCNCSTDAGTLVPDTLALCTTQSAQAVYDNNFINDGDDVLRFILHTNPGAPPGTIIAWNTTPVFNFGAGMVPGVTYYISAIAGNPDAGGMVDLNDPCLSVSPGVPVVFYSPPFAAITANDSICPGQQALLPVSLSGNGPYALSWTFNGAAQGIGGIPAGATSYQLSFNVLSSTQIILTGISDQYCSVVLADTALVYVGAIPQIQNPVVDCDFGTGTYTLRFSATGTPPFSVSGMTGNFVGNQFTGDPIAGNLPYVVILNDADACAADTIAGTPDCTCTTSAGVLSTVPLFLCAGDTTAIAPSSGVFLNNNDVLQYHLVDAGFNTIAINQSPVFSFDAAGMNYGTTYFILAYAGDTLAGGGIDITDPCLSLAIGPGVLWNAPITGNLSGDATICAGDSATLTLQFTGEGPWNATYTANGVPVTLTNIVQTPLPIYVEPTVNTVYVLTQVAGLGGNCTGTAGGQANVQISVLPQVLNPQITCNFANNTFVYQFDLGNGAAPNSNYAIGGISGILTDTTFVSNPLPTGTFSFTVTDDFGCSVSFSGEGNCDCQTDAGSFIPGNISACLPGGQAVAVHNNDQSLDADDVLGFVLCTDPANLPASVISSNTAPNFTFQPTMTAGTAYFIVAVAGNNAGGLPDWNDPCLSQSTPVQVIFYNPPTATIDGDTSVCRGSTVAFKIRFTGDSPFTFQYALNGIPQPIITAPQTSFNIATNNIQQTQVFTLISIDDEHCPGTVNGSFTIDLINSPTASLIGDATICLGDTTALQLLLTDADSADVSITDGSQVFTLSGLQTGDLIPVGPGLTSNFTISALTVYGNDCTPVIGTGATVNVSDLQVDAILSDYNGLQISCFGENDGSIALSPSGGVDPVSAVWSSGQTGLVLQQLVAGIYSVLVTDQVGCQYADTFVLREAEPLQFSLMSGDPRCADPNSGVLFINQASGGNGPIQIFVNGSLEADPALFPWTLSQLQAGDYTVELVDLNGCESEDMAVIQPAAPLTLDLGPDIEISLGENVQLIPVLNTDTLSAFQWSPESALLDPFVLSPFTNTINTLTYSLTVIDTGGCTATDDIMVIVTREKRVYIPNGIAPEGAQADNTVLTIFGGPEVLKVKYLRIYDRWGEMLFENTNFLPNQPDFGWDGRQNGRTVAPGVYIYAAEVEYADGTSEEFNGDVTVVR